MIGDFMRRIEAMEPSSAEGAAAEGEILEALNMGMAELRAGTAGFRPALVALAVSELLPKKALETHIGDEEEINFVGLEAVEAEGQDRPAIFLPPDLHHQLFLYPLETLSSLAAKLEVARYYLSGGAIDLAIDKDVTLELSKKFIIDDIEESDDDPYYAFENTAFARDHAMWAEAAGNLIAAVREAGGTYQYEHDGLGMDILRRHPRGYSDLSLLASQANYPVDDVTISADTSKKQLEGVARLEAAIVDPDTDEEKLDVTLQAVLREDFPSARELDRCLRFVNSGLFLFPEEPGSGQPRHPHTGLEVPYEIVALTVNGITQGMPQDAYRYHGENKILFDELRNRLSQAGFIAE